MSTETKPNVYLIIVGIILASGAGYVFGQSPIAGLQEEVSHIGTENLALQSQVEQLIDRNNDLLERLEGIAEDLSETQVAYQILLGNYTELSGILTSTQSDMQSILASFEELEIQFVEAKVNNSYLIGLYSSVWEKYADLIIAYNNLTSEEPIGEMVITEISGIVNGDWENGNEGWLTQGVSNLVGGVKFLHKNDRGTFTTQSVTLTNKNQGLQFKVKPQPFGGEISLEVSVNGVVLYVSEYSGMNSNFDWEIITIPFKPLMYMREQYEFPVLDIYDIRFTVLAGEDTGANIALEYVTLVEISRARYGDVPVAEAKALIEGKPDLVILDVRTPSEFDDGHIEGATNIPVDSLAGRLDELSKDDELLVYCGTGNRSTRAVGILNDGGFTKIFHMDEGITGWLDAGYPVVE